MMLRKTLSLSVLVLAGVGCMASVDIISRGKPCLPVVLVEAATPAESDAAAELAKYLGKACGTSFDLKKEGELNTPAGLFVGRTQAASQAGLPPSGLPDESYVVQADKGRVLLCGCIDMSTKYAVYGFLERHAGVRWFLPTDLFESVPTLTQLSVPSGRTVETPALQPRAWGYIWHDWRCSYTREKDPQFGCDRWAVRNRLSVDHRGCPQYHSHHLYAVIIPSKYGKDHPEYFPLRGGKRFIPPEDGYQDWQPCLSNPEVKGLFVEDAKRYFATHPDKEKEWYSLGINDGYGWCECDNCKALDIPGRTWRTGTVMSDRYYRFVLDVASEVKKGYFDRTLGLIAYSSVEAPPAKMERLPDNVAVFITQDASQYHDPEYLKQDLAFTRQWLKIANGRVYRYDYLTLGWMVPRYFPHQLGQDFQRVKRQRLLRGYYAEDVPTWGAGGPLHCVAAHCLWNPETNVDALLSDFFQRLFPGAEKLMKAYFEALEKAWQTKRPGRWFDGLGNLEVQLRIFDESAAERCNKLLADAAAAATTEAERKRVRFFARGWEFSFRYMRGRFLSEKLERDTDPFRRARAAAQLIAEASRAKAFWEDFRKEEALLNGTWRWAIDELSYYANRDSSLQNNGFAGLATAAVEITAMKDTGKARQFLEQLRREMAPEGQSPGVDLALQILDKGVPLNALQNAEFKPGEGEHPPGLDWSSKGAPPKWSFWKNSAGEFCFNKNGARITGTDAGCWIQVLEVRPGDWLIASAKARSSKGFTGRMSVRLRWQDAEGRWYPDGGGGLDPLREVTATADWSEIRVVGQVPEGARKCAYLLGTSGQKADQWVDFRAPYLGIARVGTR